MATEDEGQDQRADGSTAGIEVGLQDIFDAYAKLEAARRSRGDWQLQVAEAKDRLKRFKAELEAADGKVEEAGEALLNLIGGIREERGAPPPPPPLGLIDEQTPKGRLFKLEASDDRVRFVDAPDPADGDEPPTAFEDRPVRMILADGLMAGQDFFPTGCSVAEWNRDYAAKVEGYVDPPGAEEARTERAASDGPQSPPEPSADGRAAGEQPPDEDWKAVRLETLEGPAIPPRILAILADHEPPIETIGELQAWIDQKGQFWAKDLPGVGPAAQQKIEDALEAFWARRKNP